MFAQFVSYHSQTLHNSLVLVLFNHVCLAVSTCHQSRVCRTEIAAVLNKYLTPGEFERNITNSPGTDW